ncbi:hypothetical protein AWT69_001731 [Pseudomonas putida]|nr:hypothetical protein AWT69_001731 [Pseudomonas putida]
MTHGHQHSISRSLESRLQHRAIDRMLVPRQRGEDAQAVAALFEHRRGGIDAQVRRHLRFGQRFGPRLEPFVAGALHLARRPGVVAKQAMGERVVYPRMQRAATGYCGAVERIAGPPVHLGQGHAQFGVLRPPEGVALVAWCHRAGRRVQYTGAQQLAVAVDLLAQGLAPATVRFGGKQVLFVQGLGLEVAHLQAKCLALGQREIVVTRQHLDAVIAERCGAERPIVGLAPQAWCRVAAGKRIVLAPTPGRDRLAGLGDLFGEVYQPLCGVELAGFRCVVDPSQFAGATVYQARADGFALGQGATGLDRAQAVPAPFDAAYPFQVEALHVGQAAVGLGADQVGHREGVGIRCGLEFFGRGGHQGCSMRQGLEAIFKTCRQPQQLAKMPGRAGATGRNARCG